MDKRLYFKMVKGDGARGGSGSGNPQAGGSRRRLEEQEADGNGAVPPKKSRGSGDLAEGKSGDLAEGKSGNLDEAMDEGDPTTGLDFYGAGYSLVEDIRYHPFDEGVDFQQPLFADDDPDKKVSDIFFFYLKMKFSLLLLGVRHVRRW